MSSITRGAAVDASRHLAVASSLLETLHMTVLDPTQLAHIVGGADTPRQAQLRNLAKSYCPQTYSANKSRPMTRALGERCLDEAGYGSYKSMLDNYFPK